MKKKSRNKRWRLIADPKLQGVICLRVAIYWVLCQITIFGTMFGFSYLDGGRGAAELRYFMFPAIVAAIVMLPVVLVDVITFSNRFAGPIHNFRCRFTSFTKNGETEQLMFRPGDYFPDLQENFNQLCERMDEAERSDAQTDEQSFHTVG